MKNFINKYLKYLILFIQIIASCLLVWVTYTIGSIPTNYIIIGIVVLILLLVIEGVLLIRKPSSKKSIITMIVSILLSIVIFIGSSYLYQFGKVVDLMSEKSFQSRAISVIVLKDSDILNEKLLKNKKIGYISYIDSTSMEYAIDDIKTNIGNTTNIDYNDFEELITALYDKKVDAIILDEAFRDLATSDHDKFDEETRVVYQIKKEESSVDSKSVDVTSKPFLVYISGNDEYGELSAVSRSDVNMLVVVNPSTKQILLLSIPRDTYYRLHTSGQLDKFTHSGMYGLQESIDTLQDMLDEDINYYVKMNFTSFIKVIDALGGITIDVPKYATLHSDDGSFTTKIGEYTIYPGENTFNSKQALAFVRERKSFVAGDFVRGQNQQLMIKAIIKKECSPTILTSYSGILDAISNSIETNMSNDEINALVKMQLSDMPNWDVQTCQIIGDVANKPCYSLGYKEASVVVPYQTSIDSCIEKIDKVIKGETVESDASSASD